MSDINLHKRVSSLASVNIELPLHQRARKAQLLAQYSSQRESQNFMSTFVNTTKGRIHSMKRTSKVAAFGGVFASVAVVTAVAGLVFSGSPVVSAAEQLSKSSAVVKELSPAEKAALNKQVDDQLAQRLAEARQSSDLKLISAKDFSRTTDLDPAVKLRGISIKSFLAYSAPNGQKTIIVIDTSDKPVLVLVNLAGVWASPPVVSGSLSSGGANNQNSKLGH